MIAPSHGSTAQPVSFPPSGRRRFGSTRCVLIQSGASSTGTVSPSPVDLVSSPSFLHWPTPSCGGMSMHVTGVSGPIFSTETSSIGSNVARFKLNLVMVPGLTRKQRLSAGRLSSAGLPDPHHRMTTEEVEPGGLLFDLL